MSDMVLFIYLFSDETKTFNHGFQHFLKFPSSCTRASADESVEHG